MSPPYEGTRRDLVNKIMMTAMKMRSIADEQETLAVAAEFTPTLYSTEGLNVMTICEKLLEGEDEVTPIDCMNLLHVVNMLDEAGFSAMFAIRWECELPEPMWAVS